MRNPWQLIAELVLFESMNDIQLFKELKKKLEEIAHLGSALSVLHWDQEVYMPEDGADQRAKTIGYLSTLAHEKLVGIDGDKTLSQLRKWSEAHPNTAKAALIESVWRDYSRGKKLPAAFVEELSVLSSTAQVAWAKARQAEDFKLFAPHLKRMVELKKREAEYVGYKKSPYDALLDVYEPGLTSEKVTEVFNELRDFLKPFVKQIAQSKHRPADPKIFQGKFPLDQQQAFNKLVAEKMGFNFAAGRLDASTHPFTINFHPRDVRITTRYNPSDVMYSLGSTIHEAGHAMYEQGLPFEHFGTPLGEAISLGIHESQSRLWENKVGKGRSFWNYFYPQLQKTFPTPFKKIPFESFYRTINQVKPSLIRTESDEVTYNLHIILRYEIEKDLIEGKINVRDLPEIWNAKVKEYLGIKVPNDRLGVLQDVHWSGGSIGYFPTYTLGNLYAAQFYHAASKQLPSLEKDLKAGNFSSLREWLRTSIHQHGKRYSSEALVEKVTGEALNAKYFTEYLTKKYSEIYKL